jgi:hypothetical protein
MNQLLAYLFSGLGGIVATVVAFRAWDSSRIRRIQRSERSKVLDEIRQTFIGEIANDHLPHIYTVLEKIADKLELHISERPAIRYLGGRERVG